MSTAIVKLSTAMTQSARCLVNIHTDLLPANVTYFQTIHVHRPLKNAPGSGIDVDVSEYEFIGAVCPGNPEGNGNFDFRGCGTDNRQERKKERKKERGPL